MIDIYSLDRIKRLSNYAYYNENKLTKDDLHKMLMKIRKLVR